jgi:hypothetical protein
MIESLGDIVYWLSLELDNVHIDTLEKIYQADKMKFAGYVNRQFYLHIGKKYLINLEYNIILLITLKNK